MKFTLSWLKAFLKTQLELNQITDLLTQIGFEVEDIIDKSLILQDFTVAQIITATKHPDADKLQVCQVDTGSEVLQIVCGAPNARAGIKVVLAKIGSKIPNGNFKIKESLIRGVSSYGMLCSASELLIGADSDGIIEMPSYAILGTKFAPYYGLEDPVIHINVTPNRSDALGVYGIARDLAAAEAGELIGVDDIRSAHKLILQSFTKSTLCGDNKEKEGLSELVLQPSFDFKDADNNDHDFLEQSIIINVEDDSLCPVLCLQELKNIKNCESPVWLKFLLQNIGLSPISLIVDVTNYITYSFGQPIHAYDAQKLAGSTLSLRVLSQAQDYDALNGKEYKLMPGDLVMVDQLGRVECLAGIIGGGGSACSLSTSRVLLESAQFSASHVARTGRRLQIDTDARYRFERNIDPYFVVTALNIASDMLLALSGGSSSASLVVTNSLPPLKSLEFGLDLFEKKTGIRQSASYISTILTKLGFEVLFESEVFYIKVPSWRHDINIEEDIVEEVMRIYGYNNLPEIPLPVVQLVNKVPKDYQKIVQIKQKLASYGYDEVVTWSFMDTKDVQLFADINSELILANPISSELNYMRPTIIPNLLKISVKNRARSVKSLSIFEVGPIFSDISIQGEGLSVAGLRYGHHLPRNSHEIQRAVDLYDIKSDIDAVLSCCGIKFEKLQVEQDKSILSAYYHPTRSASLLLGKNIIGRFGALHPDILKYYDLSGEHILVFEIFLHSLPFVSKHPTRSDFSFSVFQPVNRDFAFLLNQDVKIGDVLLAAQSVNKKLIKAVNLFDIYSDAAFEGKRSVAFSVLIQADDHTLTEDEISAISDQIISKMSEKFMAQLRYVDK